MQLNIEQVLKEAYQTLAPQIDSARLDAELLLADVLQASRLDLISRSREKLSIDQHNTFQALLKRRLAREPVAYILGHKEFFGLDFEVSPAVLIPRPETEHLVEQAIQWSRSSEGKLSILDLGTGSGCIALALGNTLRNLKREFSLTLLDQSTEALRIAKANASKLGLLPFCKFVESDWFCSLDAQLFDLILSNPPYIQSADKRVSVETKFEPQSALYAGSDGLEAYRNILLNARKYLTLKAAIMLEIGSGQAASLRLISQQLAYDSHKLEVLKDLAGLDRVFCIYQD